MVRHLQRQGVLAAIEEQVLFARRRFGQYELIDFVAVLFGYAVSSERTLEAFYQRLHPWADAFMALFGRSRLPARSTLSRFLSALDQATVEALRNVFLHDLLARPLVKEEQPGGLWDRLGNHYIVFDIDGTREAARQRALPVTADRPAPVRRLRPLCARGYTGRKRGEVVRERTTVLQAHVYQWLATDCAMLATESIVWNCAGRWRSLKPTSRRTSTPKSGRSCDWMANTAMGSSSRILQDYQ